MGRSLTYELGKVNIGRRVKVRDLHSSKGGSKQHGIGATLMAAHPKYAECRIDNHKELTQIDWLEVRDWTSMNPSPLIIPKIPAAPVVRAAGHAESKPPTISINYPAPIAEPTAPPAPQPPKIEGGFADIDAKIDEAISAVADAEDQVDAALEMYQDAQRYHTQAVEKLDAVRSEAQKIMDRINARLVGTSRAQPPTSTTPVPSVLAAKKVSVPA